MVGLMPVLKGSWCAAPHVQGIPRAQGRGRSRREFEMDEPARTPSLREVAIGLLACFGKPPETQPHP